MRQAFLLPPNLLGDWWPKGNGLYQLEVAVKHTQVHVIAEANVNLQRKQRSLNNSRSTMFISCDLFPPDSSLFRFFVHSGTCKFMQYYASLLVLSFYSLSRVFFFYFTFYSPKCSSVLFLLIIKCVLLYQCFGLVRAFVWRWHPLAK